MWCPRGGGPGPLVATESRESSYTPRTPSKRTRPPGARPFRAPRPARHPAPLLLPPTPLHTRQRFNMALLFMLAHPI